MSAAPPALTLDPDTIEAARQTPPPGPSRRRAARGPAGEIRKSARCVRDRLRPSGLPHIGTLARSPAPPWCATPSGCSPARGADRLIAFSDDMDGLARCPKRPEPWRCWPPISTSRSPALPDPFGTHGQLRGAQQRELRRFLDAFGFRYEFPLGHRMLPRGVFDATLLRVLERYDAVMEIIAAVPAGPALGELSRSCRPPGHRPRDAGADRRGEGRERHDRVARSRDRRALRDAGDRRPRQAAMEARWAMRWVALGVDYEKAGKDLIVSVKLSGKIAGALAASRRRGSTTSCSG